MTLFDIKPTTKDYKKLCIQIGFDTVYNNRNNAKIARTIDTFFGDDGLDWFIYGIRIAQMAIDPYKLWRQMYTDIFKLKGGDK